MRIIEDNLKVIIVSLIIGLMIGLSGASLIYQAYYGPKIVSTYDNVNDIYNNGIEINCKELLDN